MKAIGITFLILGGIVLLVGIPAYLLSEHWYRFVDGFLGPDGIHSMTNEELHELAVSNAKAAHVYMNAWIFCTGGLLFSVGVILLYWAKDRKKLRKIDFS